jgi:DNA-binding NarL/FixJ family response regulator
MKEPAGSKGPQILFVDDEPRILEGLRDLLRPRPYRLCFATSAEQALDALRSQGVDVVVTDERMPGLQGSAFCAIMARDFPSTPRLILTGHASVELALTAINEGRVTGLLRKPVKAAELEQAVETALTDRARQLAHDRFVRAASELLHLGADAARGDSSATPRAKTPTLAVGDFRTETMRRLTPREREVFDLVVEGYRVSQVAKLLFRSHHTVRNHLKAIFQKLEVSSQEELVTRGRLAPISARSRR